VGGLMLEGGRLSDISSITAAMIVLAGTAGAVMITTPMRQLISAAGELRSIFWDSTPSNGEAIEQILKFAKQARRSGLTSLEGEVEVLTDPFLKKALALAVDGADLQDIRRIMELEIELAEHRGEGDAKVFETAGGYAPTIGIIGAVLGLIQVMKHLEDIERVGHGIAVAFVATVYGVAFANLFLLPAGAKLRSRLEARLKHQELLLEGVLSLAEGMNPMLLKSKLEAYQENQAIKPDEPRGVSAPAETRSVA
jgi:chemotaxis protein MotA